MEKWKAINGFEDQYEISNLGNLRSIDRIVKHYIDGFTRRYKGSNKKIRPDKDGYLRCTLKKDGKSYHFRVHRLVADAFISNERQLKIVNHLNGIKTDNRVENLEWCNHSDNVIHAVSNRLIETKLTDEQAIEIFNSKLSNRKLGEQFKINSSIVWRIKNKKAYKHLWHKLSS
jgi:hypothetical protein